MPARNSVKIYAEDCIYHLYNRGVEKRDIFLDEQDFAVLLSYLKTYLLPKNEATLRSVLSSNDHNRQEKDKALKELGLKNFSKEINLLTYSLLPNHFHLILEQVNSDGIDRFMNALATRYSLYFNRKYHRVGPVCQGVYKAVIVQSDEQLLHLSRYIHLNALNKLSWPISKWRDVPWPSSLHEYFGLKRTAWVKPERILSYFNQSSPMNTYSNFMGEDLDPDMVAPLAIDFEDE